MKNFIGSRSLPDMVYHAPESVEQLLPLLSDAARPFRIVAGCTDFIPAVRTGRWSFDEDVTIIDIKKIKAFNHIEQQGGMVHIGACTRLTQLLESPEIQEKAPVLARAVATMGSWQVRNTATIGGNICMSSPAGDTIPALLVLDARVTLAGPDGEEEILLKDFLTGPGQNTLAGNQVMTRISFPAMEKNETACFKKIGNRTAVIISIVSTAVRITLENGVCRNANIAMGSVAPTPIRIDKAEAFLEGKRLDPEVIHRCAALVSEEISPITDLRASGNYRRDVAATLVKRAIAQCTEENV
ncbi:MAG TPA: xanthine dehydrogenase family protein subunit M [Desulfobacteraceae bacterium]|nr:xanthine dehydrogenase family protein subunit M [Desulfobacteraceae bacterium]